MQHIGDYLKMCKSMTLKQFLAVRPPPVLVHDKAAAPLKPTTSASPGETMFRLAIGDTPSPQAGNAVPKEKAFAVYPITTGDDKKRFLIGCSLFCDIYLNDASVSREHAWVENRNDRYVIQDNDSTSGTWVNGDNLEPGQERTLQSGDTVVIGGVEILYMGPGEFYTFARKFLGVKD